MADLTDVLRADQYRQLLHEFHAEQREVSKKLDAYRAELYTWSSQMGDVPQKIDHTRQYAQHLKPYGFELRDMFLDGKELPRPSGK